MSNNQYIAVLGGKWLCAILYQRCDLFSYKFFEEGSFYSAQGIRPQYLPLIIYKNALSTGQMVPKHFVDEILVNYKTVVSIIVMFEGIAIILRLVVQLLCIWHFYILYEALIKLYKNHFILEVLNRVSHDNAYLVHEYLLLSCIRAVATGLFSLGAPNIQLVFSLHCGYG